MGIQTLHKNLKSICEPVHVSDYQGCTAGIDAYAWLHRGAQACPVELCQGQWTDKFVRFCLDRVAMLKRNHVDPLLVFDGASVRAKSHENKERRRVREASLQKAHAATERGNLAEARINKKTDNRSSRISIKVINLSRTAFRTNQQILL